MTRSWYLIFLGMLMACAFPGRADEVSPHTFSANVAFATDYVYRGQSQTSNDPAVSGGFDYGYSAGDLPVDVYAGTWASNISFGGSIETDWYGGISGNLGNTGIGWNTGFLYYWYPGASSSDDLDFVEGHIGLSYDFTDIPGAPSVGFTVHWSPDWQTSAGDAVYYDGNVGFILPYEVGLSVHVGRQTVEKNAVWGTPDWTEWNVSLSKGWRQFEVAVGYYDTDLSRSQCFAGDNICGSRVLATVSASF